jgi:hypothetical protein
MKRKSMSMHGGRKSDAGRSTQMTNPMQKMSSNMGQQGVIKVPVPGVPGWVGKPGGKRGR